MVSIDAEYAKKKARRGSGGCAAPVAVLLILLLTVVLVVVRYFLSPATSPPQAPTTTSGAVEGPPLQGADELALSSVRMVQKLQEMDPAQLERETSLLLVPAMEYHQLETRAKVAEGKLAMSKEATLGEEKMFHDRIEEEEKSCAAQLAMATTQRERMAEELSKLRRELDEVRDQLVAAAADNKEGGGNGPAVDQLRGMGRRVNGR